MAWAMVLVALVPWRSSSALAPGRAGAAEALSDAIFTVVRR
jgi:hypothetical protein